jgi:hypothetical protein
VEYESDHVLEISIVIKPDADGGKVWVTVVDE